jgi:predicted enzyme related to lactoylglutathione lyase
MPQSKLRFVGVELYFEDLETAKRFYRETLGLKLSEEQVGHHAKFGAGSNFICLERKGTEGYPSLDKAVLFFEVPDLAEVIDGIGRERVVQNEPERGDRPSWAVIHDPEGHNILLLQTRRPE